VFLTANIRDRQGFRRFVAADVDPEWPDGFLSPPATGGGTLGSANMEFLLFLLFEGALALDMWSPMTGPGTCSWRA